MVNLDLDIVPHTVLLHDIHTREVSFCLAARHGYGLAVREHQI